MNIAFMPLERQFVAIKYRNVSAMCVANEMFHPAINSSSRYAVHRLNTNGLGQTGTKFNGSNVRRVQYSPVQYYNENGLTGISLGI